MGCGRITGCGSACGAGGLSPVTLSLIRSRNFGGGGEIGTPASFVGVVGVVGGVSGRTFALFAPSPAAGRTFGSTPLSHAGPVATPGARGGGKLVRVTGELGN